MSDKKEIIKSEKVSPDLSKEFEKENSIVSAIKTKFSDRIKVEYVKKSRVRIFVNQEDIVDVAYFLRDHIGLDHAEAVAGTDFPKNNEIEITYHLGSYTKEKYQDIIFLLVTRSRREEARTPSLINVFKSAEYFERETYEMLGVYFDGHPRNERFLLPEDWADLPPLRRDFRIKGR